VNHIPEIPLQNIRIASVYVLMVSPKASSKHWLAVTSQLKVQYQDISVVITAALEN
tara:strand:- start:99235 stop:99402 length:168 start_codon:yes stop_codon:yes gene_type:complete